MDFGVLGSFVAMDAAGAALDRGSDMGVIITFSRSLAAMDRFLADHVTLTFGV